MCSLSDEKREPRESEAGSMEMLMERVMKKSAQWGGGGGMMRSKRGRSRSLARGGK